MHHNSYTNEVQRRQKGTACDVAIAESSLHDGAEELLKFDIIDRTLADLGHAGVTFTISNYVIDDVSKTLRQLRVLRKIISIVATIRSQILRIKCIKFDFGWGSAPDLAGELTALPDP